MRTTLTAAARRLPAEDGFVAVSTGYYHACGLKVGGVVQCWGLGQMASYCDPPAFAAMAS